MTITSCMQSYRFADHGHYPYAPWTIREPQSVHRDIVQAYTRDSLITRDTLVAHFKLKRNMAGAAAGVDGIAYQDITISEFGQVAADVVREIRQATWRPQPSRIVLIPKPSGGQRRLDIRCIVDRTVSSVLAQKTAERIDPILSSNTFGFRPSRNVHQLLAEVICRVELAGMTVITQDDIRDAFPSVTIEHAMEDYSWHVIDQGLFQLIETVLKGHQQSRSRGIDQGDPLSPPTLNQRLHYCLDLPNQCAGPDGTHRYRYVDNLIYQCRNVSEGSRAVSADGTLLEQAQFRLKGVNNSPVNLRRSGAQVIILGFKMRLVDESVVLGIENAAYDRLCQRLELALGRNDSSRLARTIIHGWIESLGPAFESGGMRPLLEQLLLIAANHGFREIGPWSQLEEKAEYANRRWQRLKEEVRQQLEREEV